MKALTKLLASIIVATLAVVFTSCGEDDFDYDPKPRTAQSTPLKV